MLRMSPATVVAISFLSPFLMCGQSGAQSLSITNYQYVSQKPVTANKWNFTYRADLVNPGAALASVTATLTSGNPASFTVVPGQDTLTFTPVPANSQTPSSNTTPPCQTPHSCFTILVDRSVPFDNTFSQLKWTFQTSSTQPPVANAGPNQTVKVGSVVTLDGSGSTNPSGVGTLTYSWAFTSRPSGSTAVLTNPTSVMPTFIVDVGGTYVIGLTVSNGQASSTASVTVSTGPVTPVANAGPDQTVTVGSTVHLNGSGSTDANGNSLTFAWSLVSVPSGSAAALTGANTVAPSFVADKVGTYKVQLIVNNGFLNSAPSVVTITDQDVKPVANAGPNQTANIGTTVQLDGSKSTSFNGNPLTYKWSLTTLPAGSSATLSNPNIVNPTFKVDAQGTYVAQLIVNDGFLDSDPATVTISTNQVLAPTANAGTNQTVAFNATVQLNGSGTDPQNLPLTFSWSLTTKPAGSAATLSSATIANPTFVADKTGTYIAQLIVNNGFVSSQPSTVTISTTCNQQPTANAGPNQNVTIGATVTLDGSGSTDACHDALTYSWTFNTRPNGSNASLTGANTVSPTFVADVGGTYVAQLIVNNGFLASNPSTVSVTAVAQTVISLTPNPLTVVSNSTGTLTVTLSAPAGGSGQVVNLSSSNTGAATVPASVTVAATQTTASVTVTPAATGSTTITASATGLTSGTATVNVVAPLKITTQALANGTVNVAYNATVAASGGTGALTWSATGLPAGLNINSSTGAITGTPTTAGTSNNVVVTVTDSGTPTPQTATATFSITISSGLTITTASLPNGVVNAAYPSTTVAASGGTGALNWSISGQPTGLSINATTGVISGTPTTAGTSSNVVVTVTDSGTPQQTATKTFSITIATPLSITTTSLPNGIVNTAYPATTMTATGGTGALTWSISGQPAGLTINPTTGVISGTPTAAGTSSNVVVTVNDSGTPQQTATATFSITIAVKLAITTASLPNGVVGTAYPSTTVAATGGTGTLNWSISGQPAGLSINATTGVISGTPSAAGTSNAVVVTVTDSGTPQQTATATFSITIAQKLTISTTSLPNGIATVAYPATTVAATGGTGALTWSISGQPGGLSINPTTGVISGTPAAAGTSNNVVVTVTDSGTPQQTATKTFSITIAAKLAITTASLPNGVVNTPYSAPVTASGGTGTLNWSIAGQPTGLGINAATGVVSGTPTVVGTSNTVVVTVTDSGSPQQTATATYSITISAPAGVPVTIGPASVGQGLQGPVVLSIASALPADLTFTLTSTDTTKVMINGGAAGVVSTLSVTIPAGQTSVSINAIGVAVGQGAFVASGAGTGQGAISVTPSGFLLIGPGGTPSFNINQGQSASLTVQVAQLDAGGNVLSTLQPLALGAAPVTVTLTSTSTTVGDAPAAVTFHALDTSQTTTFNAKNSGATTQTSTTLTASVPANFTAPAGNKNQVVAFVNAIGCALPNVTVGKNLETNIASDGSSGVHVTLSGSVTATGGLPVVISSTDSSKFLLAANASDVPSSQITLTVPQTGIRTSDFYIVGVGTGTAGSAAISANAGNFGTCTNTSTLAPSGFVISASSAALNSTLTSGENQQSALTVFSVALNASLGAGAVQPVSQSAGTVNVSLSSSDSTVGTATTPVTFSAGQATGQTLFTSLTKAGSTNVSISQVSPSAGFTTPSQNTAVAVTVQANVMHICGDPSDIALHGATMVGFHLQTTCTVTLSQQTTSPVTITLTSSNPGSLLLSTDQTVQGSTSIQVTIPANSTASTPYFVQNAGCPAATQPTCAAVGSTPQTAQYTASGGGFNSTGTITMTPSGALFELGGVPTAFSVFFTTVGGTVPLAIDLVQLDPVSLASTGVLQSLAPIPGSSTVTVPVDTDNHAIGTVTSPTFSAGSSTANAVFTGVAPGKSIVTLTPPSGFGSTGIFQTLAGTVQ